MESVRPAVTAGSGESIFAHCPGIRINDKKHPSTMGAPEITKFLSWLATGRRVSSSTQNQALSTILFPYKHVLHIEVQAIAQVPRAKMPVRVPVVLTQEEVATIVKHVEGTMSIVVGAPASNGYAVARMFGASHHADVTTTMVYTLVLNRGALGVRSPFDRL